MPKVLAEGKTIELGIGDWGLGTGDWEDLDGDSDPNQILLIFCCPVPSTQNSPTSAQQVGESWARPVDFEQGNNLRKILLQNGIDLYNDGAKVINSRGIGSCGTCTVKVEKLGH